jgi:hypothetical protein
MTLVSILNRRALVQGCLLLLSAGLLRAADQPKKEAAPEKIHPWTAGGKNHGPRARQDDSETEGDLSWLCSKMWSFYKGRITFFRPGKDEVEKGEEVYWTKENTVVGTTSNRRIWVIELAEDTEKKGTPPALMFLMDEQGLTGGLPGTLSQFFFLAGAKGDKLEYKFDEGKDDVAHLIVTQQPAGKGAAHSYEFSFTNGMPKFIEPPKGKKK